MHDLVILVAALSAHFPGAATPPPRPMPARGPVATRVEDRATATVTIVHAARVGAAYVDQLIADQAVPRSEIQTGGDGRRLDLRFFDFQ